LIADFPAKLALQATTETLDIVSWCITCKQNDESTSSRYRGGNVDAKLGSAHFLSRTGYLAGRLAVSSSQKTRSLIFCWLSRKERAKSRKNWSSYIVALRFLLLLAPRKDYLLLT